MTETGLQPRGEALRKAVRWLGERGRTDPLAVEEAAVRFDLSPLEEAFLLEYFSSPISRMPPDPDGH